MQNVVRVLIQVKYILKIKKRNKKLLEKIQELGIPLILAIPNQIGNENYFSKEYATR